MAGLKAGPLRHRVSLQERILTQDSDGNPITAWEEVSAPWASVEPLSAREFIAAQAQQSAVTTRIRIRYRDGVNAQMRVVHRGRTYNIQGVLPDPDSGLEWLTLPCSEGVNDG